MSWPKCSVIFDEHQELFSSIKPVVYFDALRHRKRMPYDPISRRQALRTFLAKSGLSMSRLAAAAHLSESSVRHFLAGRAHSLGDDTWCALADAASTLLHRDIAPGELRGDDQISPQIAAAGYVGAGAEIHAIDDHTNGAGIEMIDRPPGLREDVVAVIVRGESMYPVYRDGDVLFYARNDARDLVELVGVDCVVRTLDGRSYVKLLRRGSRRGVWTLTSHNAPDITDVRVEWAAPVRWIQKARR
jgi:Peptidase S24-like